MQAKERSVDSQSQTFETALFPAGTSSLLYGQQKYVVIVKPDGSHTGS